MDNITECRVFAVGPDRAILAIVNEAGKTSYTRDIIDSGGNQPKKLPGTLETKYPLGYAPYGDSDTLPYEILEKIGKSEVVSQNKFFNSLIYYGQGLSIRGAENKPLQDEKIERWFLRNRANKYLLDQCIDMVNFLFTVSVIILNAEGNEIVQLRHKEAIYCRFESADEKGKINHVFFGNFSDSKYFKEELIEAIPLLDINEPIWDLLVRTGKEPNEDGLKVDSLERMFAIVNAFPTPGRKYYPKHPSWAMFESGWYDILTMIPKAKKAKFKNSAFIKWKIDIDSNYFPKIFQAEGISNDPQKCKNRKEQELKHIEEFISGAENAGKAWVSMSYLDLTGKYTESVRFTRLDDKTEGGDWLGDTEEASNMICYADGVHPHLQGAVPGKNKGGTSGTDKRELLTMKQLLSKPFRDLMLEPYHMIAYFNSWPKDITIDIPVVTLTTLDTKKDAEEQTFQPNE